MTKNLSLLGSTGSIGTQSLDVARKRRPTQIVPGSGNFTFSAKTAFAVENQAAGKLPPKSDYYITKKEITTKQSKPTNRFLTDSIRIIKSQILSEKGLIRLILFF